MFNKRDLVFAGIGITVMVLAFVLLQDRTELSLVSDTQTAGVVMSSELENESVQIEKNMKVQDVVIGSGKVASDGDTVHVHYTGKLENGQEFDSSKKRGEPLSFTLGEGRVIAGWEQGLLGMQEGGTRVLTIPPELAYGERGIGPIPPNATLTFTIELLEVGNE